MPISLDEFKKGSEITDRKPATDFMQPSTAYSTKEISELLGISQASARQRLLRHLEKSEVVRKKIRGKAYWALITEEDV